MKRHGLELSIIFLAVASVATSQDTAGWKNCTDDQYGVTFQYPNHWQRSDRYTDIEFEGPDGSVQVDASEGSSLKTICRGAANHKMKPYGEHPHIQFLKVHDLPACIVWPSADQGAPHLAELIVEYPSPITIKGDRYSYMVMYADKDHIRLILNTFHFIPSANK